MPKIDIYGTLDIAFGSLCHINILQYLLAALIESTSISLTIVGRLRLFVQPPGIDRYYRPAGVDTEHQSRAQVCRGEQRSSVPAMADTWTYWIRREPVRLHEQVGG